MDLVSISILGLLLRSADGPENTTEFNHFTNLWEIYRVH